jgi:hypothetical protein
MSGSPLRGQLHHIYFKTKSLIPSYSIYQYLQDTSRYYGTPKKKIGLDELLDLLLVGIGCVPIAGFLATKLF